MNGDFEIVEFQVRSSKRVSNVLLENNHQSGFGYLFHSFKAPYVIKGEKIYGTINLTALDSPMTEYGKKNVWLNGFTLINEITNFFFCQLGLEDCTKVRYHSLSQRDPAYKCVSFKLKSKIYVIGMFFSFDFDTYLRPYWRCDCFDIEKDEYQKSCHLICSDVSMMSGVRIFSVATDPSESYALILTNYGLLTFTEENGFKYKSLFRTSPTDLKD